MHRLFFIAAVFVIFASPAAAQQTTPEQTPPAAQPAAPPVKQATPEAPAATPEPQASPEPVPPPFPPMPSARPSHRWVDVGGGTGPAHHRARRSKPAHHRAAHVSRKAATPACKPAKHGRKGRHSTCRRLARHHVTAHRHDRLTRRHKAAHSLKTTKRSMTRHHRSRHHRR
jgi:hypothetical protein